MSMQPDKMMRGNDAANSDVAALRHLRKLREPFADLNTRIVTGILHRVGLTQLTPPCHVVEIGAGDGQLKDWLPASIGNYLIQTESSPELFSQLTKRCPDNHCIETAAHDLPFPDASVDAVLSLGSYDALAQPKQCRDEITRVLKPGGWFIHFLDSGAQLNLLFKQMHDAGELPLPNFLAMPVVTHHFDKDKAATLPATELLDDIVITRHAEFTELVAMFIELGHPLAKELDPYLQLFAKRTFDPITTTNAYKELLTDPERLTKLNAALLAIYMALNETNKPDNPNGPSQTAGNNTLPFTITFSASWKFLRGKLESHFSTDQGYDINLSRIVASRQPKQRDETVDPRINYIARCVGQTIPQENIPASLLGTAVEALDASEPDLGAWRPPNKNEYTLESGMYVFAAQKYAT